MTVGTKSQKLSRDLSQDVSEDYFKTKVKMSLDDHAA